MFDGKPNATSPAVHIKDLRKIYVVSQQEANAKAVLQGLMHRRKVEIPAVDGMPDTRIGKERLRRGWAV